MTFNFRNIRRACGWRCWWNCSTHPWSFLRWKKYLDSNWFCLVVPNNLDYARWESMDARLSLVCKVLDGE